VSGAEAAICGVPFEMAISRSGMSYGPQAIRTSDYLSSPPHERPHLSVGVDALQVLKVVDYGDAGVTPYDITQTHASVRAFIREIVEAGCVPIVLGGDHSITWPDVAAMADVYGPGNVGVVHFDAHADTADDVYGSLVSHASPIRRLIEDAHIPGRNFVQVGLRGYWPGPELLQWAREHGVRAHHMAEIERFGFERVMERAIEEALDGPTHLFVSLDVDVLDPAFAPGTGGIEPGGLTTRELLPMIRRLGHEVGISGMDIVEVCPPFDTPNPITAIAAHRAVLEALTGLAMRKLGLPGPHYLSPEATGQGVEAP
jgi:agmatinase